MEGDDFIYKLKVRVNDGYKDLVKWIIGLSSGIIVFSTRMVTSDGSEYFNSILIYGLGLHAATILFGVLYVRYGLDATFYNLMCIGIEDSVEELNSQPDSEGKKKLLAEYTKNHKKQKGRIKIINSMLKYMVPLVTWCFILGTTVIVFYAYLKVG